MNKSSEPNKDMHMLAVSIEYCCFTAKFILACYKYMHKYRKQAPHAPAEFHVSHRLGVFPPRLVQWLTQS